MLHADPQLDVITLTGIEVDCYIGIFPHERLNKQPLQLDLSLSLPTREAAKTGSLKYSVDYGLLHAELRFLLDACQFRLLETAAEALSHYLLAPPPPDRKQAQIEAVTLTLRKPRALAGRAVAGLSISRKRSDALIETSKTDYGAVEVIYASRDCSIFRQRIAPGAELQVQSQPGVHEAAMALSKGLCSNDVPVVPETGHFWQQGAKRSVKNASAKERSLVRVTRPNIEATSQLEAKTHYFELTDG